MIRFELGFHPLHFESWEGGECMKNDNEIYDDQQKELVFIVMINSAHEAI